MSDRVKTEADSANFPLTVVIIGAGFSGLGAAVKLAAAGIDDFTILERADDLGGTWRDNTYPGVACDVPSLLYSYSFAQNPRWSEAFASGAEILEYLKKFAVDTDVQRRIDFGQDVTAIDFDEDTHTWTVTTTKRKYTARNVIVASGPLSNHSLPDIEGIGEYTGKVMHTADWDHSFDFTNKRVAVVGTGSTGVQVVPRLVKTAEHVAVFQRTAGWVVPRLKLPASDRVGNLYTRYPRTQSAARNMMYWGFELAAPALVWDTIMTSIVAAYGRHYLRKQVSDKWTRRQLEPQFRPGCKRMLMSSEYYDALQANNCKLITWPIARVSEHGIKTCEGVDHHYDVIVFATGYETAKNGTPYRITGKNGKTLSEEWSGYPQAYKSVNVAGYPNLFFTFGPNAGPGHTSAIAYVEAQIDYTVKAITLMRERNLSSLDVDRASQDRYNRQLQKRLKKTTWNSGCSSWYLTADGFNPSMFPGFATQYRRQLKDVELHDYRATGPLESKRSSSPQTAR